MASTARKGEGTVSAEEKRGNAVARVIRMRREEMRLGQRELAELVGAHAQTMNKIERGEIEYSRFFPKLEVALQLPQGSLTQHTVVQPKGHLDIQMSRRYRGVSTHETLDGRFTQVNNGFVEDLPLFSSEVINFDEHVMALSAAAISLTARPSILADAKDAYAVLVSTFSMIPAYEPGDTIYVSPDLPALDHKDVLLRRAGDSPGGADVILCRLMEITATHWVVREYGTSHKPRDRKVLRKAFPLCHRVICTFSR